MDDNTNGVKMPKDDTFSLPDRRGQKWFTLAEFVALMPLKAGMLERQEQVLRAVRESEFTESMHVMTALRLEQLAETPENHRGRDRDIPIAEVADRVSAELKASNRAWAEAVERRDPRTWDLRFRRTLVEPLVAWLWQNHRDWLTDSICAELGDVEVDHGRF